MHLKVLSHLEIQLTFTVIFKCYKFSKRLFTNIFKTEVNILYKTQSICIKSVYKSVEWPCALYIENSTAMPLFKIKLLTYLHATLWASKLHKSYNILNSILDLKTEILFLLKHSATHHLKPYSCDLTA